MNQPRAELSPKAIGYEQRLTASLLETVLARPLARAAQAHALRHLVARLYSRRHHGLPLA